MGDKVNVRLDTEQKRGLERMQAAGVADNQSEALRTALSTGLAEYGYLNGHSAQTRLRWVVGELAKVFGWFALAWLSATLLFPVEFRLYAVGWFAISLGLFGAERVLADAEPGVSRRLAGLVGGGERA